MIAAINHFLAQSTGQVSAITLLSALLAVFVAFTIYGAIRHPSGPGLVNLGIVLTVMYVGWTAARWPGVDPSEGMFLGFWHMLLDCFRTIWDVVYDVSGLDSLAKRIGTNQS
jgi:hypothetical protein